MPTGWLAGRLCYPSIRAVHAWCWSRVLPGSPFRENQVAPRSPLVIQYVTAGLFRPPVFYISQRFLLARGVCFVRGPVKCIDRLPHDQKPASESLPLLFEETVDSPPTPSPPSSQSPFLARSRPFSFQAFIGLPPPISLSYIRSPTTYGYDIYSSYLILVAQFASFSNRFFVAPDARATPGHTASKLVDVMNYYQNYCSLLLPISPPRLGQATATFSSLESAEARRISSRKGLMRRENRASSTARVSLPPQGPSKVHTITRGQQASWTTKDGKRKREKGKQGKEEEGEGEGKRGGRRDSLGHAAPSPVQSKPAQYEV